MAPNGNMPNGRSPRLPLMRPARRVCSRVVLNASKVPVAERRRTRGLA
jgi:hypothetical protein